MKNGYAYKCLKGILTRLINSYEDFITSELHLGFGRALFLRIDRISTLYGSVVQSSCSLALFHIPIHFVYCSFSLMLLFIQSVGRLRCIYRGSILDLQNGLFNGVSSRVFYSLVIKPASNQTILLWFSVASSVVHRISREMEVLF